MFYFRMLPNLSDIPKKIEGSTEEEDEVLLSSYPYIEPPFRCDYGSQINIGEGSFINMNCTVIDVSTNSNSSQEFSLDY